MPNPNLRLLVIAGLVLSLVGQTFLSAAPGQPAPPVDSKKKQPVAAEPVAPQPAPAKPSAEKKAAEDPPAPPAGEGTLIKRKKKETPPAEKDPAGKVPAEDTDKKDDATKKKDEPPLKSESKPAVPPGKTPGTEPPQKPVAPEDDALLKSLGSKEDDPDDVERLERAIAGMRQAQQRMEEKDSGKSTQEIQQRVVKDLDFIINSLQNPKQPPQDQNQDQQNQKNKQQQKGKQRRQLRMMSRRQQREMREQMQKQQQQASRNQQEMDPEQKSRDTSQSQAPTKAPKEDKDRQKELVKDVWGHLPPNVRDQLLNAFSEKYLPKYEDLVRRYYEALAEKNRNRNPGR